MDAHCHAYGFSIEELKKYKSIEMISVSEDLESSLKSIRISEEFSNIKPFIGLHPWKVPETPRSEVERLMKLCDSEEVIGLGEVGLDGRMGRSYGRQKEVFEKFCEIASEYDLPMNLHALDAWRDVLEILRKHDVEKAILHWYSGPIDLLEEIFDNEYMITVNPSVRIQRRHRKVLEEARMDMILTESDGPYQYRGLNLTPEMIPDLVRFIAEAKALSSEVVEEIISKNFRSFLR